jgi:DMSO reductase anchor subunit
MLWMFHDVQLQFLPVLLIGLCLSAGLMTSFAHLGTKRNAWRVLNHLRKSWLSREILFTILFGAGWLATVLSMILHTNISIFNWLTALIGIGLIRCMSQVYRLRSVPAWDSWRTNIQFFLSAALLGILGMVPMLTRIHMPPLQWTLTGLFVIVLLIMQTVIVGSESLSIGRRRLQLGLILTGMIGCAIVFFIPGSFEIYSSIVVLLIVLAEQCVGRWFFYQARITW